jgi:hypothetical protein
MDLGAAEEPLGEPGLEAEEDERPASRPKKKPARNEGRGPGGGRGRTDGRRPPRKSRPAETAAPEVEAQKE